MEGFAKFVFFAVIAIIMVVAGKIKEASEKRKAEEERQRRLMQGSKSTGGAGGGEDPQKTELQRYLEALQSKQKPSPAPTPPPPQPKPALRPVVVAEQPEPADRRKEPARRSVFDRDELDGLSGRDPMAEMKAKSEAARARAEEAKARRARRSKGRGEMVPAPRTSEPARRPAATGVTLDALARGAVLTPRELRTAVALREILGPPRALRPYRKEGYGS